jgi:hypothetical protein
MSLIFPCQNPSTLLFQLLVSVLICVHTDGQISVDYWLYYPESGATVADFTGTNYVQLSEPSELQSVGIAVHTQSNVGYFLSDSSLYEWDFASQTEAAVILADLTDLWFITLKPLINSDNSCDLERLANYSMLSVHSTRCLITLLIKYP